MVAAPVTLSQPVSAAVLVHRSSASGARATSAAETLPKGWAAPKLGPVGGTWSDGVSADKIIDRLIASTPTKEDELLSDARFKKIFAS